jgi:NAD(P)-dependent dehydrogenase (short-subunit alcohol dehydrogenase family)
MSKPFKKTALLTGGSRGIGAAIAETLIERGVAVVAPGRQELDLADPVSVDQFIAAQAGKRIDILINNAGINILKPLEEIDDVVWQQMNQVNLHAPFQLLQGFAPRMKVRRWGRIVNISSVFSLVTRERRISYTTMKSGLNGMTRAAAVELGPCGILVNAVCPGYVQTEMTRQNNSEAELDRIHGTIPLRRLAEPREIARFVAFLCSEENTYITGQLLVIDGGFACQ